MHAYFDVHLPISVERFLRYILQCLLQILQFLTILKRKEELQGACFLTPMVKVMKSVFENAQSGIQVHDVTVQTLDQSKTRNSHMIACPCIFCA